MNVASAMVEGARLRLRRPVSSLRAYVGWAAFDMRMMFQGYLERGFVAEDGDTETLTKLLGHPPRRYRALQGRQPKRGNPKQNRFSVNLLREKGGRVVKPGNRLDKRHTHLF